jgi:AcrR family transcriptional regulator
VNPDSRPKRLVHSLRSRLKEATTDAILDAAEQTLADQGIHEASMSAIAARAGVSVGTLYNHFHDRNDLVLALFRVRREAFLTSIDAALAASAKLPFRDQLAALVGGMLRYLEAHRTFYRIALESEHDPLHKEGRASAMANLRERAEKVIRRGVQDTTLRPDTHGLHAGILTGILKAVLLRTLGDGTESPSSLTDHVIELFLHGSGRP